MHDNRQDKYEGIYLYKNKLLKLGTLGLNSLKTYFSSAFYLEYLQGP